MSRNIQELQSTLEHIMCELRGLFPTNYRLTLVARNASLSSPDRDIVASEDQLDLAVRALERVKTQQLLGGMH